VKKGKRLQNSKSNAYTVLSRVKRHIYKMKVRIGKNVNVYINLYEVYTYIRYMKTIKYKVVSIYSTVNKRKSTHVELAWTCTQVMVNKDVYVYLYSQSTRENRRDKTYVNVSREREKYAKCVKVIHKASVAKYGVSKINDSIYVEEWKCIKLGMVYKCVRHVDYMVMKVYGKRKNGIRGLEKMHLQYISKGNKYSVNSMSYGGKYVRKVTLIIYRYCVQNLERGSITSYGWIPVLSKMSTAERGEEDVEMADPAGPVWRKRCMSSYHYLVCNKTA
jgi:hypothetical protein